MILRVYAAAVTWTCYRFCVISCIAEIKLKYVNTVELKFARTERNWCEQIKVMWSIVNLLMKSEVSFRNMKYPVSWDEPNDWMREVAHKKLQLAKQYDFFSILLWELIHKCGNLPHPAKVVSVSSCTKAEKFTSLINKWFWVAWKS